MLYWRVREKKCAKKSPSTDVTATYRCMGKKCWPCLSVAVRWEKEKKGVIWEISPLPSTMFCFPGASSHFGETLWARHSPGRSVEDWGLATEEQLVANTCPMLYEAPGQPPDLVKECLSASHSPCSWPRELSVGPIPVVRILSLIKIGWCSLALSVLLKKCKTKDVKKEQEARMPLQWKTWEFSHYIKRYIQRS